MAMHKTVSMDVGVEVSGSFLGLLSWVNDCCCVDRYVLKGS